MAAPTLFTFSLLISLSTLCLLISPSLSLTCSSQKLPNNKVYADCSDLPKLGAFLHYTYDAANSSLTIAYVASPASGGAWVSWAINPTATGMIGAQAIIALKLSDGSVTAKTYNISSYRSIVEEKLSFDVWDLSATEANGTFSIFASVKVPEKATKVNHVWQVGGLVNLTQPGIHPLKPENKESVGELNLVAAKTTGNSTITSPAPAPSGNITAPAPTPSGSNTLRSNVAMFLLFLLFSSVMAF